MAKPDTDDGWLKYAHELDAALAVADFSKGARIVLREVFAQIFGRAKKRTAVISATEIATAVGQHKQNIWRAVQELCEFRVLKRQANGSFRFNKDYESWLAIPRGKDASAAVPRFTREEIAWCRQASARMMAFADGGEVASSSEAVIQMDYQSTNKETPSNPVGLPKVIPLDYQKSSNGITASRPRLIGPRAEFENSRNQEEENTTTPLPPSGGQEIVVAAAGPSVSPEKPASHGKRLSTAPRQVSDAEIDALAKWARAVLTDRSKTPPFDRGEECFLYGQLGGYCASYPVEWIEIAIQCASVHPTLQPSGISQYINKCLVRWHANDGPDTKSIAAAEKAGSAKPRPPAQYVTAPAGFAEHSTTKSTKGPRS